MDKIKVLDCTLRDGGYINDWNFGERVIKQVIAQLIDANVDLIEVGFLRNCEYDKDKTLFNSIEELKRILPEDRKNSKIVAMALHNMYDIDKLEENRGVIDAIRVTFHDYDIKEGLEFCARVKAKGYQVFTNPINLMGYSDEALLRLIDKVNQLTPYGFSIVDTFGSMSKNDLTRIYALCENNLDKDIVLGLHLHENMAMAYSLAQTFLESRFSGSNCILDASLNGMGRVPGNLCLELMADYLNKNYGKKYGINHILDAIEEHIMPIKETASWGYKTEYFLSAKYNLHRNYAEFLLEKGRLTSRDINQILALISEEKKSAFDKDYIESLYRKFLNKKIDDSHSLEQLRQIFAGRKAAVLAPGKSLGADRERIREEIAKADVVITTNFYYEETSDFAFFSNSKRYDEYKHLNPAHQTILTSNISADEADYKVDYYSLAEDHGRVSDNCGILLLRLLKRLGAAEVFLAGFDGFQKDEENYMQGYFKEFYKGEPDDNRKIAEEIRRIGEEIPVTFLTPSLYQM